MIKVRTKHGIKLGNVFIDGKQIVEITEAELDELKDYVELVDEVPEDLPPIQQEEEKPKGRRKKKE